MGRSRALAFPQNRALARHFGETSSTGTMSARDQAALGDAHQALIDAKDRVKQNRHTAQDEAMYGEVSPAEENYRRLATNAAGDDALLPPPVVNGYVREREPQVYAYGMPGSCLVGGGDALAAFSASMARLTANAAEDDEPLMPTWMNR